MLRHHFAIMSLGLLLAAGCKVGPEYQPPEIDLPTNFQQSTLAGPSELSQWWQVFEDPTLTNLITEVSQANLDIQIAQSRIREARALYLSASAITRPQVDAQAAYTRSRNPGNMMNPPAPSYTGDLWQAGLDARWEIDIFGGLSRTRQSGSARVLATEEALHDLLIIIQAETARTYIEVRLLETRLAVARNNVQAEKELLALAEARYQAGVGSQLDLLRAQAQTATSEAQLPAFEAALQASMHRIAVLLGRWPGEINIAGGTIALAPPAIPAGQPGDLLQRRPDIRQAEQELISATAEIGVAKADLYPRFYLLGSVGQQSARLGNWWHDNSQFWSIGPQITWPLLSGGRVRANIEVQNQRQEQALIRYQQTIINAVEEVETALSNYAWEQRRLELLQKAVESTQMAHQLAQELYQRGIADFTTVLDAQRSVYALEDQLVQSQAATSMFAISVYKALGGGWETQTPPETP